MSINLHVQATLPRGVRATVSTWQKAGWAGLDAVKKRKNPYPYQESDPGSQGCNLITILTEIPRITEVTEFWEKLRNRELY
jgi:hypothetical protein